MVTSGRLQIVSILHAVPARQFAHTFHIKADHGAAVCEAAISSTEQHCSASPYAALLSAADGLQPLDRKQQCPTDLLNVSEHGLSCVQHR